MKIFLLAIFFLTSLYSNILQDAINNAPSGSTLKLPDGIYLGNITINKPLTLVGKDKKAVIDGGGQKDVITITSSNVILDNLTITNSGDKMYELNSAINITKSKNIKISNCKILNSLYGINMFMVENSEISANYISSKDKEISQRGNALKVYYSNNNLIQNNIINKSRDVTFNYSNNNIIKNNTFTNNRFALHLGNSHDNTIEKNSYKYNSVSIMLMGAKNTTLIDNSIKSSKGAAGIGVMLKGVSGLNLKKNIIKFNAKGIYIDSKATEMGMKRDIQHNDISFNKEAIRFHLVIRNNTISNNKFIGNIDDIVKSTQGYRSDSNIVEYNYWDRYSGFDKNKDNIGDNPYYMYQYADQLWQYNNKIKFFYASPIMSLLDFLSKLAPFIEPILLLEDSKPLVNEYSQPL